MGFMVIFMVSDPRSMSSRKARKGARSAHAVQITPLSTLCSTPRGNIRTARRTASDILVAAQQTGRSRPPPQEPREVCPKGWKQGMP